MAIRESNAEENIDKMNNMHSSQYVLLSLNTGKENMFTKLIYLFDHLENHSSRCSFKNNITS